MNRKIALISAEANPKTQLIENLKLNGYEVITATDGRDGLHRIHNENPDLVILECLLPHLNGCEVCSLLKRDVRYRDIPILMLSAFKHEDIEDAPVEHPDCILHKPFSIENLLVKIQELIQQADTKKEEIQKQLSKQDVEWMKERYNLGLESKGIFF